MNAQEKTVISRADVEKALIEFTGYTGDQTSIDAIMVIISAHIAGLAEALAATSPLVRESCYHTLMTMAEQLLDTGGKLRLVNPNPPPPVPAAPVRDIRTAGNGYQKVAAARPKNTVNDDGTITCRTCRKDKATGEYFRDSKSATGFKGACKPCEREQKRKK
jgi:hypothetical protein